VYAVFALVVIVLSVPYTRRARRILDQLPPSPSGPDPAYQAKVYRQVRIIWRWTGVVFAVIAVAVLVVSLVGAISLGIAAGVWIGLALLWGVGYFHSSWMVRPR
jgi:hypothetical protein